MNVNASSNTVCSVPCELARLLMSVAILSMFAASTHAQLTALSQNRYVTAASNCNSGCTPASQTITAPDFAPFIATATANSDGGSLVFAQGSALAPFIYTIF